MVKISIIVPVYNSAKYLEKCIESLLTQTLGDIEIIFIDDDSSDNSIEILNEFGKKTQKIKILTQEHKGQSAARNYGLSIATGELIGFVDSDDWVHFEMFDKLYSTAKKNNSEMAMCSFALFNEKTGEIKLNDPYMSLNTFNETFMKNSFSPHQTLNFIFRICVSPVNKIYKKSIIKKFPEGLFFEDNLFFIQTYLGAKNVSLINEPLYFYRKNHGNSTVDGDDFKKLDFFKIFELMEKFLKTTKYWEELKDYFYTHKKNTLNYWYKKLNNENVKKEFYSKMGL